MTMKDSIYIAGPMRGYELFNFPAFDEARETLKAGSWDPISPADLDREAGFDPVENPKGIDGAPLDWSNPANCLSPKFLQEAMKRDVDAIVQDAGALCLLPGWEKSTGAKAELALARWKNIPVYLYPSMKLLDDESICEEAHRIQGGDRQQDYGSPKQNFHDIADMWHQYLTMRNRSLGGPWAIDASDVANMMILMKMSRNTHKPKRDNWVDICGYAQCGAKCEEL